MNIRGFNHLTLRISSLQESLSFYTKILGMKLVHLGRTDAYLEWGDAWICLLEKPEDPRRSPSIGMDHVAFTVDEAGFQEAITTLERHNVPFVRPPIARGGGLSLQFLDPNGIIIELTNDSLAKRMKTWK